MNSTFLNYKYINSINSREEKNSFFFFDIIITKNSSEFYL